MAIALRNIPFRREVELLITYKGEPLATMYRADFICYGEIIVELKAISNITPVEVSQLINYLKATGCHRGLLLNFGTQSLQFERKVFGPCSAAQPDKEK